jgi:hypothetical protein
VEYVKKEKGEYDVRIRFEDKKINGYKLKVNVENNVDDY